MTEPHIYIFQHKELQLLGIGGELEAELEEVDDVLKRRGMETARWFEKDTEELEVLAAVSFKPIMDIQVNRSRSGGNSDLVVSAVKRPSLNEEVIELASAIGLESAEDYTGGAFPDLPEFYSKLQRVYKIADFVSKRARTSMEAAYGAAIYIQFLEAFRGQSRDDAITAAMKKFKILTK